MAVASIFMVIGFTYKRIQADRERRQRRERANQDQPGPRNDAAAAEAWPSDLPTVTRESPT
ncbi:hypothetical protein GCK32_021923, partial [Trichostrongylus colubriformis]